MVFCIASYISVILLYVPVLLLHIAMLGGREVLVVVAGSFNDAYNSSYAFF